ncbi:MAG: RnfABCDGE type electron transport complex subunit D [Lactimicrobium massiliense]|nr:RnfABCDGE type electron transport complex subunit D [Lactimicrobium massiliense]MDD6231017.1 RnfABCDGE type electron transport complex subunit D [Lactimicrobium massiliense]
MKLSFHASPNYRDSKSTSEIMRDLTVCLLAVLLFSIVYYGVFYGVNYGVRVACMALTGVAAAMITEALWFKAVHKDVRSSLAHSYGWVTALIMVLISKITVSYYAIAVATVFAIIFGKMVFGGFGQNIFNPAAFGEAIIMNGFASSTNADFTTTATPMATIKSAGWVMKGSDFSSFMAQYGGFGKMFLGYYPSVIGSTSALLIILCYIFLVVREDINWRTPLVYVGSIVVISLIAAAINGNAMGTVLLNVLAGGTLFGAVFMLTDPVTSPVTIPGKYMFAVGAAALTCIIRWRANLPDGVLYSILLMNMLAPAIDRACAGSQIKDAKKIARTTLIVSGICLVIAIAMGATVKPAASESTESAASTSASTSSSTAAASASASASDTGIALNGDFKDNEATCEEQSDGVYACKAKGFGLINNMGGNYSENEATITVKDGKIVSVEVTKFGDTKGVGDAAVADDALAAYKGLGADDSVDATTGATYTSTSIASMAAAALAAAGK